LPDIHWRPVNFRDAATEADVRPMKNGASLAAVFIM